MTPRQLIAAVLLNARLMGWRLDSAHDEGVGTVKRVFWLRPPWVPKGGVVHEGELWRFEAPHKWVWD